MKSPKSISFLFLSLVLFITACSSDDSGNNPVVPEIFPAETMENVSYGTHPQQVYDIYLPEGRSSSETKVLILVHGGGWTEGDKSEMSNFIPLIQENHPQHAIVNMNYVLATSSSPAFPHQFLDLGKVIDQLTSQKESLQILPEFGLIGISAGAHISLQYDYVYDTEDQVKMVCDIVGPADFTDPFYTNNPNFENLVTYLVDESAYPPGTNYSEVLSPALHVTSFSSPSILFYGTQDPLVPVSNAERLKTALENAAVPHSLTFYDGGHGDWDVPSYTYLQIQLSAFIEAHLKIL